MTREEAIKKAINIVAYCEAHFAKSKESREDAANIIEALEQEPRWIPVSERLPKKNGKHNTFLVTDHDGNLSISKFYLPLSNSDIEKPYWSGMIDVIAWMPLPEPYRAESEEQA